MNAVERYRQRRKQRLVNRMRQADDVQEASRLATIIYTVCYPKDDNSDGGPGSGNWGHESIPGVRGGSKPGGGKSHRQGSSEEGYTSEAKEKKKAKEAAKNSSSSKAYVPTRPVRPKKSEYTDENGNTDWDALEKARNSYKEAKAEWDAEADRRIKAELPEHSMTAEEVGEWCKKTGTSIYGSIDNVDGRLLASYTKRFEQLAADFPEGLTQDYYDEVEDKHYVTGFELSSTDTLDFMCEASNGITFGGICQNAEWTAREHLEQQGDGYVVNTDNGLNSLWDHEYGHRVYQGLKWAEGRTTRDRVEMEEDLISSLYGKSGMSEYATTNAQELFAEGFAAYYAGETTEFAKATGEFIERWRKK